MGKKIKKIFKKTSLSHNLLGKDDKPKSAAPVQEATPAPAAAVEAPKEDKADDEAENSESARKAARARGKRGLSVSRSSGSGINI